MVQAHVANAKRLSDALTETIKAHPAVKRQKTKLEKYWLVSYDEDAKQVLTILSSIKKGSTSLQVCDAHFGFGNNGLYFKCIINF